MANTTNNRKLRKVSSWISDSTKSIENEKSILAVKKIVLKVLRYMDDNHLTQKELAEKLRVSPQYINKFLHGRETDIKISTAINYGEILGLNLIEIPDDTVCTPVSKTICYTNRMTTAKFDSLDQYEYSIRQTEKIYTHSNITDYERYKIRTQRSYIKPVC